MGGLMSSSVVEAGKSGHSGRRASDTFCAASAMHELQDALRKRKVAVPVPVCGEEPRHTTHMWCARVCPLADDLIIEPPINRSPRTRECASRRSSRAGGTCAQLSVKTQGRGSASERRERQPAFFSPPLRSAVPPRRMQLAYMRRTSGQEAALLSGGSFPALPLNCLKGGNRGCGASSQRRRTRPPCGARGEWCSVALIASWPPNPMPHCSSLYLAPRSR